MRIEIFRYFIQFCLISSLYAMSYSSTTYATSSLFVRKEEKNYAYVTILFDDEMAAGIHVLQSSLLSVRSEYKLSVLVTSGVSSQVQSQFERHGINIIHLPEVTISGDRSHLYGRSVLQRWRKNLSKLWLWKLVQFDKIIYLDADVLVVQNIDHLFGCKGPICAGIDQPIPDRFSTGVMVFKPDIQVFDGLVAEWRQIGFFEDVEQGLLNRYYPLSNFDKDQILPFKYNAFAYCEDKNVLETTDDVYVIHFVKYKPWIWYNYPAGDLGFVWRQYYDALSIEFKEDVRFQTYALSFVPMAILLVVYLGIDHRTIGNRILKRVRIHWISNSIYVIIAFGFEACGYLLSSKLVPYITTPFVAWFIVYEWSLFSFLIPVILWTSTHFADETKNLSTSSPLPREESNVTKASCFMGFLRYWRFFVILLLLQPFLALFMNFYYHTSNADTPITLRCVIMFLSVTLPLHLLGLIFACLVPRVSRKLASDSRVSLREISKL